MILYETLSQSTLLFILLAIGFACGFLFDFIKLLTKNKVLTNILDFFAVIISFCILYFVVLAFSYGQMRIWHILVFVASVAVQRATCGHLLAKLTSVCYNFFHKKFKKGK